jgi:hypothetical protein
MGIEQLLQRLQTRVTGVTGLHDCFIKDFSVTPEKTAELEVTEVDFPVTPATHCNLRTFTANVNEINDVTPETPVTLRGKQSLQDLKRCKQCRYVSRFGNCTVPIASGLSEKFMLISHPQKGVGCAKFQPSISEKTAYVLLLIVRALRIRAIDEDEAERARDAVLRADSIDYQYVIEYESLIRACIRCIERGERRDDS